MGYSDYYNAPQQPLRGQQEGQWLILKLDLAELFRLPRLPELIKDAIKTMFQPRWPKGRWRSKT